MSFIEVVCNKLIRSVPFRFVQPNFSVILLLLISASWPFSSAFAESVCASVKIEIQQELTLERQGFLARMRINNGLDTLTIDNVDVVIKFTDENGNAVIATSDPNNTTADFFIREDQLVNIANVSGTGVVNPNTTADISWIIIPAPGAGGTSSAGKLYFVGATLSYSVGGVPETVDVAPDFITVKPMPLLTLDYFLTRNVYADDPFTPEIEPAEPFTLGVRVTNNGQGDANDVAIESAQPKIVENEQGLLINFEITGSSVNDQPTTPSLLMDFGTIPSSAASVGRWVMETTLTGEFTEFSASFIHADELGGELTSLLEATNTYNLIRDVLVDEPGRDLVRDFLADDGLTMSVFESSGLDTPVTDQSVGSTLNQTMIVGSDTHYSLTTPVTAGAMYVKLPDPSGGLKEIKTVIRSDGKSVPLSNAWGSKFKDASDNWEYFVNFFDTNSSGSYTVVMGEVSSGPLPPIIQFVPDRQTAEGQQVSFLVEASDPNGTIPILSAAPLPAGASFTDHGNGTATFDWTPAVGQSGNYFITYTASDGVLSSTESAYIKVNPDWDTDGDGMDDAWEMANFGTLDRDGTGDFDGDGISDLQEYLDGSDPTMALIGPGAPVIQSPTANQEEATVQPTLAVTNSNHLPGVVVTYDFEIYNDAGMTNIVASMLDVAEGTTTTSWLVSPSLEDNTWYYWRARAYDGNTFSPWVSDSFFVNTVNNAPVAANPVYPATGASVGSLQPLLQFRNGDDVDGDGISHVIEIYSDATLTILVTSSPDLTQSDTGFITWQVGSALTDGNPYYWQVVTTDEHGVSTISAASDFLVSASNGTPAAPALVAPEQGGEASTLNVDLVVSNAVDPEADTLTYFFEIDTVPTFNSAALQTSLAVTEGVSQTTWTATALAENANYYWRARVNDGLTDSAWVNGQFLVNTVNDAPSVPVIDNPDDLSWVETLKPVFSANPSTDPDGDGISYNFEVYLDNGLTTLFDSFTSSSGLGRAALTLSDLTTYYWRAQAVDEHGLASAWSAVKSFRIVDNGVNDAPVITPIPDQTHLEGDSVNIQVSADDLDGDVLTYLATGLPTSLSIDINTGLISGTLGIADSGVYSVTVTVNDSIVSANTNFTLTVTENNTAPVLAAIGDLARAEGSSDNVAISATDAEGGTLVFSATGLPLFATLTDNLNGTATLSLAPGYEDAGSYVITVTVTDNGVPALTDSETLTITVNEINRAPVLTAIGNQAVDEAATANIGLSGSDPDSDSVSFSATGLPAFATLTDNLNGTATLSLSPGYTDAGTYPVTITLSDNRTPALTSSESITITVNNINRAPAVTNPGAQANSEGDSVSLQILASDADGETLSYAATVLPGGLSINTATGLITGVVSYDAAGSHNVTITVGDGIDNTVANFTWTVSDVNRAPVLNPIGNQSVDENSSTNLALSASDPDGQSISFSATGLPAFAVLTDHLNGTATLALTPDLTHAGTYPVTITVTDNGSPVLTDSESFTLTVNDVVPGVTTLSNPITADLTLLNGVNYETSENLVIPVGIVLTVQDGATVKFTGSTSGITVDGQMVYEDVPAVSTRAKFTSSLAYPAKNSWKGIVINSTSVNSVLSNIDIEYTNTAVKIAGGQNVLIQNANINNSFYGVYFDNIGGTLSDSTINNNTTGVYITVNGNPTVSSSTINNNTYGINVNGAYGNPTPSIHNNTLENNSYMDLYTSYMKDDLLDVSNNWWGTTDIASIISKIYDQVDNYSSGAEARFAPFLDAPDGNSVYGTMIVGDWDGSRTLTANTTYQLIGKVNIPAAQTMLVPEGVNMHFYYKYGELTVNGTLDADGTVVNPVRFSSPVPYASMEWRGIMVKQDGVANLDYAQSDHATYGASFEASTGILNNTSLTSNSVGLSITGGSPVLNACTIADNSTGVYAKGSLVVGYSANPVVNNSVFINNTSWNYYVTSKYYGMADILDTTNNWWGTTDTAVIDSKIYDDLDYGSLNTIVDYNPVLTTAP